MSFDYTIAAIPTEYRGRQYRSRLEARWAAFFDRLGWRHEYEPYDLGTWSPDFLLSDLRTLVEVKPLSHFTRDVWEKAASACQARQLFDQSLEFPMSGLLLTNSAPAVHRDVVHIGWLAVPLRDGFTPEPAYIGWLQSGPTIVSVKRGGWWSVCGDAAGFPEGRLPESHTDQTMEVWAKATNDVQWKGVAK